MILSKRRYLQVLLVGVPWLFIGCNSVTVVENGGNEGPSNSNDDEGAGTAETPEPGDETLPDFSAADVNVNSTRFQETVSPRDYLGQVSAWYFGHST